MSLPIAGTELAAGVIGCYVATQTYKKEPDYANGIEFEYEKPSVSYNNYANNQSRRSEKPLDYASYV